MKTLSFIVVSGVLIWLGACKTSQPDSYSSVSVPTEAKSPIVLRVENAGAGDLEHTDNGSMQTWFAKHIDVAREIGPSCKEVSQSAAANWHNSTEGRVCTTAASASWLSPSGVFQAPHHYPTRKY